MPSFLLLFRLLPFRLLQSLVFSLFACAASCGCSNPILLCTLPHGYLFMAHPYCTQTTQRCGSTHWAILSQNSLNDLGNSHLNIIWWMRVLVVGGNKVVVLISDCSSRTISIKTKLPGSSLFYRWREYPVYVLFSFVSFFLNTTSDCNWFAFLQTLFFQTSFVSLLFSWVYTSPLAVYWHNNNVMYRSWWVGFLPCSTWTCQ